jgi:hypothetical protein
MSFPELDVFMNNPVLKTPLECIETQVTTNNRLDWSKVVAMQATTIKVNRFNGVHVGFSYDVAEDEERTKRNRQRALEVSQALQLKKHQERASKIAQDTSRVSFLTARATTQALRTINERTQEAQLEEAVNQALHLTKPASAASAKRLREIRAQNDAEHEGEIELVRRQYKKKPIVLPTVKSCKAQNQQVAICDGISQEGDEGEEVYGHPTDILQPSQASNSSERE